MIRSKNYTQRINVHQDNEGGINLSQTYVPIRYLNSTSVISITNFDELTDVSVSSEEGTQDWLTIFSENEKINLHAKINDLTAAREALITVTAKRKISGETVTSFINLYQGRGGMTPYVIDLPDFGVSSVYKVMDGTKQVAQISKEFLRLVGAINAQAIVIYPVENDVVYLNKGYVVQIVLENKDLTDATATYQAPTTSIHGGTVSFDIANNKISGYVAGTQASAVTRVYMPGDVGMGPEEVPGSKTTTVEPQLIIDVRGAERNEYPIVKIGAQYWMGKNLNTAFYNQNKAFASIPTNKSVDVDRLAANYAVYGYPNGAATDQQAIVNRSRYGLLYSYLAIGGFNTPALANLVNSDDIIVDNLSPEGWLVPTYVQAEALANYLGGTAKIYRIRGFKTWADANDVTGTNNKINPDDNISGFAAINGSYRATGGGWENLSSTNAGWYWTRTFRAASSTVNSNAAGAFHTTSLQSSQPALRSSGGR